jgi:hypothetical protein
MFLRIYRSFKSAEKFGLQIATCKPQKRLRPQIANLELRHLKKVRKSNKYSMASPQVFGFAVCGTLICEQPTLLMTQSL